MQVDLLRVFFPFRLASMYLRTRRPQKLVGLVKYMVRQTYFVHNGLMVGWWKELKSGGHIAAAEEILVAQREMSRMRRSWI